jgi:fatty-acyl-CoA synthase
LALNNARKTVRTRGTSARKLAACLPAAGYRNHGTITPLVISADRADVKARQGVELLTSGELRVVDSDGQEVPADLAAQ